MSINRKTNQTFRSAAEEAALDSWVAKQDAVMNGVAERAVAWAKLSPQEKLLVLDGRPGNSRRQRTRLNVEIARAQAAQKRRKVAA
jgi:hypothetical protein